MAGAGTLTGPRTEPAVVAPRRARRPVALLTVSYLVAAVLALPLVFLLIEARGAGWSEVAHLIFRPLTGTLLWNTVRLTAVSPWRAP
jgi:iron(III) transport system permease protein